jgi:hypothetical protein
MVFSGVKKGGWSMEALLRRSTPKAGTPQRIKRNGKNDNRGFSMISQSASGGKKTNPQTNPKRQIPNAKLQISNAKRQLMLRSRRCLKGAGAFFRHQTNSKSRLGEDDGNGLRVAFAQSRGRVWLVAEEHACAPHACAF